MSFLEFKSQADWEKGNRFTTNPILIRKIMPQSYSAAQGVRRGILFEKWEWVNTRPKSFLRMEGEYLRVRQPLLFVETDENNQQIIRLDNTQPINVEGYRLAVDFRVMQMTSGHLLITGPGMMLR